MSVIVSGVDPKQTYRLLMDYFSRKQVKILSCHEPSIIRVEFGSFVSWATGNKKGKVVKIENVVACAALKHGIDLGAVVKAFPVVDYQPKRFPGLVFKLKRPRTTILIFSTGKMVCTGARSERDAVRALRKVVRTLNKGGMIIRGKLEIEIMNVVATASLGGKVDLLQLYESETGMRGRITYEPDQFPGLVYRMNDPKVVILLFASGKLVCTGARKEGDVDQRI